MSDYTLVDQALATGADPAMLCATCPWDRNCINPPSKTKVEIDTEIKKAAAADAQRAEQAGAEGDKAFPVGTLITAAVQAGRHLSATVCPVLALRLRSSGGRAIAENMRTTMQSWDDQA